MWLWGIVIAIALQRLSELVIARRNTARLLAQGGREHAPGHYPLIVVLHAAWLIALVVVVPADATPNFYWLALLVVMQAARLWVLVSLGSRWTTRIIVMPDAPLVARGPYRWMRHPNYAVVVVELIALPMVFGAVWIAAIFTVLNAAILTWRIREEDRALGRG
jgi:methyltransferase